MRIFPTGDSGEAGRHLVGSLASPPCERCGQPVGADRLEALPRATTCIACASLRKRPSRGQTCS